MSKDNHLRFLYHWINSHERTNHDCAASSRTHSRLGKEIDKITWKTVLWSGYVFNKYLPFHWTIPAKLFNDPPHYLLWYNDIFFKPFLPLYIFVILKDWHRDWIINLWGNQWLLDLPFCLFFIRYIVVHYL